MILLNDEFYENCDLRKYMLIIDPEDVELVNDDEEYSFDDEPSDTIGSYNEYVSRFIIRTPSGEEIEMGTLDKDPMFISNELNRIIRRRANNSEGKVNVPLTALVGDIPLFFIKINNNEISKTMNDIINIINKSSVTSNMTKDEALQSLVDLVVEGGLTIDAIHLEVILSNQIVDADDILKKPNWNNPYAQYKLLTLNKALTNNPSVIISLLYQDLRKTLYDPLSFAKNKPSFFDLFFCEDPQNYISDELLTEDPGIVDPNTKVIMATKINK